MVTLAGVSQAGARVRASLTRTTFRLLALFLLGLFFYGACTTRVQPNQWGVEQRKFGFKVGIVDRAYTAGLYFVGPGVTMHTFPREIHVLEASYDAQEAEARARRMGVDVERQVDRYFARRDRILGGGTTHRVVDALNVQTSDGYAVTADVTLLYAIADPVKVAREFGWGSLYVDSFVLNTFRNGVLTTLGKMNAESFYDEALRIRALDEAKRLLAQRFQERGFEVKELLLRNFRYADSYEKALQDKKVAVQLAEKNRKESLANEERAKLKQLESKGNAAITIAESEVQAQIAKVRAEAELYASQTRAKADKEVNVAQAEAKRLRADALAQSGGRYVVALETAKMFDNIDGAVMTPEQYIAFVRQAWGLIGVGAGGGPVPVPAKAEKK
ncbi:MAG TPA: SPFH domain-containing protein [Vicinamibacteria bacterium]|nr:SPFH domain-containing protein [Vicinamibacteria bacterium]